MIFEKILRQKKSPQFSGDFCKINVFYDRHDVRGRHVYRGRGHDDARVDIVVHIQRFLRNKRGAHTHDIRDSVYPSILRGLAEHGDR